MLLCHTSGSGMKSLFTTHATASSFCFLQNHFGNSLSPILNHCLDGSVLTPKAPRLSSVTPVIGSAVGGWHLVDQRQFYKGILQLMFRKRCFLDSLLLNKKAVRWELPVAVFPSLWRNLSENKMKFLWEWQREGGRRGEKREEGRGGRGGRRGGGEEEGRGGWEGEGRRERVCGRVGE